MQLSRYISNMEKTNIKHEEWLNREILLRNRDIEEKERLAEVRGIEKGKLHYTSAPDTLKIINTMEQKMDKIEIKLDAHIEQQNKSDLQRAVRDAEVKASLISNGNATKELKEIILAFIESSDKKQEDFKTGMEKRREDFAKEADDKYSSKWVEKIMLWAAYILGTALLMGLLTLLYKVAVYFNTTQIKI